MLNIDIKISQLYFNNYWNTDHCTNNTSNNVAMLQLIATTIAPSIFRPTQNTLDIILIN